MRLLDTRLAFLLLASGVAAGLVTQPGNAQPRDIPQGIHATWPALLRAQERSFTHLTIEDGFSSNLINSVLQDRRGYLWVGTDGGGLLRYDGYEVKAYRRVADDPASLDSDWVWTIHEASDGMLWIGTLGGGLSRFDPVAEAFHTYRYDPDNPTTLCNDVILALHDSPDGILWIGTENGLCRLDPATETFHTYRHEDGDASSLSHDRVQTLHESSDGILWLGTLDGLNRFDRATETFRRYRHVDGDASSLSHDVINTLYESHDGVLWVGTDSGLNRFDRATETFRRYRHEDGDASSLSHDRVQALHESRDRVLWVGTWGGGLNRFDPSTETFRRYRYVEGHRASLSHDVVRTLHESDDGVLWIGTGGGLNRLDRLAETFRSFRHVDGNAASLSSDAVRGVYPSRDGVLWVATDSGLNRFDPATETFHSYRHVEGDASSLSSDWVWTVYESRDGMLWVGTQRGGLNRFDRATETFHSYRHVAGDASSLSSDGVYAIHESRDGVLWLGTQNGLNRFDRATETFRNYGDAADLSYVGAYTIYEAADGILWIGSWGVGLVRFDPTTETFHSYRHVKDDPATLSDDAINTIHASRDGVLWIGTMGGLDRVDDAAAAHPDSLFFTRVAEDISLPGGQVTSITEDEEGQLWLGLLNDALARFNPATGRVRYFGVRHGLPSGSFVSSAVRSRAGTFYFGNTSGLVTFRLEDIPPPAEPPIVHLSELWLFNEVLTPGPGSPLKQPLAETQAVHFTHDQNDVTVGYVGLNYAHPEGTRYRYRLLPYDRTWRPETDLRQATYTSLPPGEYTFDVQAANSDGVWNEEGASLRITILPPWWRTPWAYLGYGLLFLTALVAADRVQRRRLLRKERERTLQRELAQARQIETMNVRLRQHEQQLEDQNRKLLELDDLKSRFFANISHEFRTPLTLILGPLKDLLDEAFGSLHQTQRAQLTLMQRNGQRLLRLINQLLDLSRLEAGHLTLRARQGNLIPLVKATAQAFASAAQRKRITLQVDVPQHEIPLYFEPDKLEKVLYNLLSNAFKFTPEGGDVKVACRVSRVEGSPGYAEILVKDTGRGIPSEALPFIFDRFHQVDASSTREQEGTGIGLALTKELVALHGGTVHAESEVGVGTAFFVRLPQGRAHLTDAEVLDEAPEEAPGEGMEMLGAPLRTVDAVLEAEEEDDIEQTPSAKEAPVPDPFKILGRPKILIVEDNDDVRAYLRSHLASDYRILEAVDGVDGLEQARATEPALVLSDVMMPGLDGYALCRAIKADEKLNHIPVVLLTAKADEESKIEGLETGADDYLYKPFNAEELLVRVENLIEIRRRLRARFSEEVRLGPSDIVVSSQEAVFLEKVRAVVEANLSNSQLTMEQVAEAVGLGLRQLHRRLKATVGLTPGGYVRMLRMERAAQLLEQGAGNVSEVAYAVGFNDVTHFSRLFKQTHGILPSQYGTALPS